MPQRHPEEAPRTDRGSGRAGSQRRRDTRGRFGPQRGGAALPQAPAEGAALTINLEAVLWAGLLISAFALRLARLDALPFTFEESSRAAAAFGVSQGAVPEGWSGDLASALTSLLFRLFDEGAATARIVPALAGGALVGAFWYTGRYIGRGAALAGGAFIALSPLAILVSRSGTAFSLGALLSLLMVLSLFAYLREQRPQYLAALVACLALAPSVDAVAVTSSLAVAAFLLIEGGLRGEKSIVEAFGRFRASEGQRGAALIIVVAALALGLTHFGTSVDKLGLAGFRQWGDMFDTPGDGRFWGYQLALLAGYDWPLALAGGLGLIVGLRRLFSGQRDTLFGRFILIWAVAGVITVTLATRRESGQLLLLLLPFALLAGSLLEEVVSGLDWTALRRWWLPLLAAMVLIAYALFILTEWSQDRASGREQVYMVLALIVAAALVVSAVSALGRDGATAPLATLGVLATVFLVHSSLAVVLDDDPEFAMDSRANESIESFAAMVVAARGESGGQIVIDPDLREPLGWYLRDEEVAFGAPGPDAAVYVAPPDTSIEGFSAQGSAWRIADAWFPPKVDLLKIWRWLLYRTQFGNLESTNAQIFLPES